MGLFDRFGPFVESGPFVSAATPETVPERVERAVSHDRMAARVHIPYGAPTYSDVGIARSLYGRGVIVTRRFVGPTAMSDALAYQRRMSEPVTLCRFSDGRWRAIEAAA